MLMEHGATDDGPVSTLFITNKPFAIRDAFEDGQARWWLITPGGPENRLGARRP
jgi:hypothetical protein